MLVSHDIIRLSRVVALSLALASPASFATDARVLNALIDSVFSAHVVDGYVDYPEIARNVRFHKYVEALAEVDLATLTDDAEKIAFWINVYNASAIKLRIDGLKPLGTLGRIKFFRRSGLRVGGRDWSLNAIKDLLGEFGDPRVLFALADSAYAGPDLRSGAYRAQELDQQLHVATRKFINDNRKNRYSDALRKARVSVLFEENADDFGGDDEAVMKFIGEYVDDESIAEALASGRYRISYLEYEWSINGRPL